jgi:hypothetical protein
MDNCEMEHKFPIGSLVEIRNGVRLFVIMHTRDCDGTPLYVLTAFKEDLENIAWSEKHKSHNFIGGISEEEMRLVENIKLKSFLQNHFFGWKGLPFPIEVRRASELQEDQSCAE